jgi:hypothetical protein
MDQPLLPLPISGPAFRRSAEAAKVPGCHHGRSIDPALGANAMASHIEEDKIPRLLVLPLLVLGIRCCG